MTTATATAISTTAQKRILVVENNETIREPLVSKLKYRGFYAMGTANVDQTRELVNRPGPYIDVVTLDMRLGDKKSPHPKGVDLGQEIREAQNELPPEFLVYSGITDPAYYEAALQLGTSAYMVKPTPEDELLAVIRVLALRRALSPIRDEIGERIERIVESKYDVVTSITKVCTDVIRPEVNVCLQVPAVFLVSDHERTFYLTNEISLPTKSGNLYDVIQDRTFDNDTCLFNLDPQALGEKALGKDPNALQTLSGAAFVPLHSDGNIRLSIGILRAQQPGALSAENDPARIGRVLSSYLRPQVSKLFTYLARIQGVMKKADRRAVLDHTSRFCLYVGQTQLDVLNEGAAADEHERTKPYFQKLKKLALDLQATGNEFSHLSSERSVESAVPATPVPVADVVRQAWDEVREQFFVERLEMVQRGEGFALALPEKDLFVAVLRVLQWMAQREDKVPAEIAAPTVEVEYARRGDRVEISFTDMSRQLGAQLREKLFEPFAHVATARLKTSEDQSEEPGLYLPLYLARTLIAEKNSGSLEDRTEELRESKRGHRFVMSFPTQ